MPHYPVRVDDDRWLVWSSVVDAPITRVGTEDEVKAYFRADPPESVRFVGEWKGWLDESTQTEWNGEPKDIADFLDFNRAGPDESTLYTVDAIVAAAEREPPPRSRGALAR